jgi:hypothetical protein
MVSRVPQLNVLALVSVSTLVTFSVLSISFAGQQLLQDRLGGIEAILERYSPSQNALRGVP